MERINRKGIWTTVKKIIAVYVAINCIAFILTMPIAGFLHSEAETELYMVKFCLALNEPKKAAEYWIKTAEYEICALKAFDVICTTSVVAIPMVTQNNEQIKMYRDGIKQCQDVISAQN